MHQNQCASLNDPGHDHFSTTYGVNFNSILNESQYFHVTQGMVPDVMHDVLEGIAPYEVKEMLKVILYFVINVVNLVLQVFVGSSLFKLDNLNASISNFPYPDVDSNCKPSLISQSTFHSNDNKINQGGMTLLIININIIFHDLISVAIQMWVLMRYLPLMIGDKVPNNDPFWDNFLTLVTITDYLLAPVISQDEIAYIRFLIEQHHSEFKVLYPNCSITPKFHFMVHYPEFISRLVHVSIKNEFINYVL